MRKSNLREREAKEGFENQRVSDFVLISIEKRGAIRGFEREAEGRGFDRTEVLRGKTFFFCLRKLSDGKNLKFSVYPAYWFS